MCNSNSGENVQDEMIKVEKPHKCHMCNNSFSVTSHLKRHISTVHDDRRPFQCTECDSSFKVNQHLKRHLQRTHGKFMVKHESVKIYTSSEMKLMDASETEKNGTRKNDTYQKDKNKLNGDQNDKLSFEQDPLNIFSVTEKKIEIDRKKILKQPTSYGKQITIMHNENKPDNDSSDLYKNPIKTENFPEIFHEEENLFSCKNSDKQCAEKTHHEKNHESPKSVMNYNTVIKSSVDEGMKTFSCEICGYSHSRKDKVRTHIKYVHEGKRPYSCKACSFRSYKKEKLIEHTAFVHEGMMTDESITNSIKIARKKKTPEKLNLTCEKCAKTYNSYAALRNHQKIHEEAKYSCKICQKKFHYLQLLQRHETTHTGEKKYLCTFCGKGFNEMSNRNKHEMALHNNTENQYSCSYCGKTFKWSVTLSAHKKTHHSEQLTNSVATLETDETM